MTAIRLALFVAVLGALAPRAAALPSVADADDVEAFAAGFLEAELRERRVPGAVFVWISGGAPARAQGFGYADVERRVAVDPDRTLFRVASVSKLVTAVAAMQLVERGALSLDDDVNERLRAVHVPDAFGEPVRVRHLLTHTGGFDDRLIGMASATEAGREPLLAHLARRMPARVVPPGRVFSYSNYGMALLGAVVEETSGEPFEAYVAEHVLRPLDMRRASFAPDAELRASLATGYAIAGGEPVPLPYDFLSVAPAGGFAATGADMGRFASAILAGGAGARGRILAAETVADMLRPHFTHDPSLAGVGLAFMERRHGSLQTFEHAGDWGGFASLLFLIPAADAGFFLSYNVDDLLVRERFVQAFLARYFPQPAPVWAASPPEGSAARVAAAAGWYRWNRVTRADLSKPLGFPLHVEARGADRIRLVVPGGFIDPITLREVEPGRFAREDGDERAVLGTGADGRVETLFLAGFGLPFAFDRLARTESPPFQLGALAAGAALALSAVVGWPIAAWRRRRRGLNAPAPLARMATAFGLAASLGWLGLLAGCVGLLATLPPGSLLGEPPRALPAVLGFGVIGALATFPFAGFALLAASRGWWSRSFRIHFAAVAAGAALLLLVLHDWNLVGFHY
ncbi:MAG TPA: serine hydrolase domain-containing protein [Myxococcota bacterium]|nr:serine hydrolase domain-containing protein [Myxococcota bacterium]